MKRFEHIKKLQTTTRGEIKYKKHCKRGRTRLERRRAKLNPECLTKYKRYFYGYY